mgnify:CR=1 FL=1
MTISICENGHVFDSDKYSNCPQCGIKSRSFESAFGKSSKVKQIVIKQEKLVPSQSDEGKTISIRSEFVGNDYVTGWLVCIEGAELGRDYRIHYGFNRVGRDLTMDICIVDDTKISRNNHCSIVYDDRKNKFHICQGKGTVTYLNDKLLSSAQELKAHDIIAIGDSKFEFIPFCREGRQWN